MFVTPEHEYRWLPDEIPTIIEALREHSRGSAPPRADGMVYSDNGRVHLTDLPAHMLTHPDASALVDYHRKTVAAMSGRAVEELGDDACLSYKMMRFEAARIADRFERLLQRIAGEKR